MDRRVSTLSTGSTSMAEPLLRGSARGVERSLSGSQELSYYELCGVVDYVFEEYDVVVEMDEGSGGDCEGEKIVSRRGERDRCLWLRR